MLDIKRIRTDLDVVAELLAVKGFDFDKNYFQDLDARRKHADIQYQDLLAQRKQASKKVGELIREGLSPDEAKKSVAQIIDSISTQIDSMTEEQRRVQQELEDFLMGVPNIPVAAVPAGKTEDDNIEIALWGKPRKLKFEAKDHVDIGGELALLDFDVAAKITGARFAVMKGSLARLHRALIQYMLDMHTQHHGYEEVNVPYIVNAESLKGTGQLPKFEEDLFKLKGDQGYYLIPTAEVPITNLMRDEIAAELPIRYVAHTPCFRSEAGSYGRDTRGMIRQHQFEKVELVQFVKPEDSEQALIDLTGHAEAILQGLDLPYRKVMLCGGDLGFSAQQTFDLEVWLPGQDKYREISSCSSFGDYQARRMKARWRNPATNKTEYLHTLNGSGLAVGRTLVAVLENYQNADGSVSIPSVLQPYMNEVKTL
jgi:seryl-tRNA synthetase|tara:strand:+ start:10280 stop:11557 length:1278 start_codon:yes stop_codon:yes gene_type:complete